MYSIGIAASILGVCVKKLRRWDKSKTIICFRTIGGHRRFSFKEIKRILHCKEREAKKGLKESDNNKCALYAKVSSQKQNKRGDLERQIALLKEYANLNDFKVIKIY